MIYKILALIAICFCAITASQNARADTTYSLTNGIVQNFYTPYPIDDGTFTGTITLDSNYLVTDVNLTFNPADGSQPQSGFTIVANYTLQSSFFGFAVQNLALPQDQLGFYIEKIPSPSGALIVCGDSNLCQTFPFGAYSFFQQPGAAASQFLGNALLVQTTPEPSSLLLLGTGAIAGLGIVRRRSLLCPARKLHAY